MSSFIARLWNRLHGRQRPLSIMLIGLDNSGKTTILQSLLKSTRLSSGCSTTENQRPSRDSKQIIDPNDTSNHNNCDNSHMNFNTSSTIYNHNHEVNDYDENDIDGVDSGKRIDRSLDATRPIVMLRDECTCKSYIKPTVGYNYERIYYKGQGFNVLDFSGHSKYRPLWQEFVNCVDGIVFVIDSSDLIRLVVVRDELETILSDPYFGMLRPAGDINLSSGGAFNKSTSNNNQQIQSKQIVISQGKLILSPLEGASGGGMTPGGAQAKQSVSSNKNTDHDRVKPCVGCRTKVPILLLANKTDLCASIDTEAITRALNLDKLINRSRHPWRMQATSVNTNQGLLEGLNWLLGEINAT